MIRRYTLKLYPSAAQREALLGQARLCAMLWNALLEMRETFYRGERQKGARKTTLSAFDMGKHIRALRADPDLPEWRALPSGHGERVAGNLDLAFQAFFRRVKAGEGASAGYPRYKSVKRADALPLREPGHSCWRLTPRINPFPPRGENGLHGAAPSRNANAGEGESSELFEGCSRAPTDAPGMGGERGVGFWRAIPASPTDAPGTGDERGDLNRGVGTTPPTDAPGGGGERGVQLRGARSWTFTLRGVGSMRARGEFPATPASFKTADIRFHAGAWWLSVAVAIERQRARGTRSLRVAFDLIDEFASVTDADGSCGAGPIADFDPREGEIPHDRTGLVASSGGDPVNAGDAQEPLHVGVGGGAGGDPVNAGDAQEEIIALRDAAPSGDPANGGDAQANPCHPFGDESSGDPANAGDAQASENGSRHDAASGAPATTDQLQSSRDRRFKKFSLRWRREAARIAKRKAREARQRRERLHRWTTFLVSQAREIEVIAPPIKDNTRTGRGDPQRPGAEVATIAALNRHVLGQAPAAAIAMLEYKAAESGAPIAVIRGDHPIRAGADLRAAAVANRRAKRVVKRKQKGRSHV